MKAPEFQKISKEFVLLQRSEFFQSRGRRFEIVKKRYFSIFWLFRVFAGQYLTLRIVSTHTSLMLPKEWKTKTKNSKEETSKNLLAPEH